MAKLTQLAGMFTLVSEGVCRAWVRVTVVLDFWNLLLLMNIGFLSRTRIFGALIFYNAMFFSVFRFLQPE